MNMRIGLIGCTLAVIAMTGGCVERELDISSNPPGAIVMLNDQEVGRTPLKHDFQWYSTYAVTVRAEGYQTLKTTADVKAPIYEWIPIDLVSELLPIPFKDKHELKFELKPEDQNPSVPALIQRGEDMKGDLQEGHFGQTSKPSDK